SETSLAMCPARKSNAPRANTTNEYDDSDDEPAENAMHDIGLTRSRSATPGLNRSRLVFSPPGRTPASQPAIPLCPMLFAPYCPGGHCAGWPYHVHVEILSLKESAEERCRFVRDA